MFRLENLKRYFFSTLLPWTLKLTYFLYYLVFVSLDRCCGNSVTAPLTNYEGLLGPRGGFREEGTWPGTGIQGQGGAKVALLDCGGLAEVTAW